MLKSALTHYLIDRALNNAFDNIIMSMSEADRQYPFKVNDFYWRIILVGVGNNELTLTGCSIMAVDKTAIKVRYSAAHFGPKSYCGGEMLVRREYVIGVYRL